MKARREPLPKALRRLGDGVGPNEARGVKTLELRPFENARLQKSMVR
jgi:hypothetical protein